MTTLLSLVQRVRGELGLSVPTVVAASSDQDILTTLYQMNAVGEELVNMRTDAPWQALNVEYRFNTLFSIQTGTAVLGSPTITGLSSTTGLDTTYMAVGLGIPQDTYILTVDSTTQVTLSQNVTITGTPSISFCKTEYSLPADYKNMVNRTFWDKTRHWEMLGPEDGQQWQWLKSGYIATGPRIRFRLMNNFFQLWPPLATTEYLGFEYVSQGWAKNLLGVRQTAFLADTDTCIYPDRLMILGGKLKYFELKGFDTTALMRDFTRELNIAVGKDSAAATLSLAPKPSQILIGYSNVPDSGFGT
jgi:hypothetical protein